MSARETELEAEVQRLQGEVRDAYYKLQLDRLNQITENQKQAAARFGFEPGGLQMAWRNGERADTAELEYAMVDALAMGGILAWSGDGVGCAAQIVTRQMHRATASEAREQQMREALKAAVRIANEAAEEWDKAPDGMRAGKILLALAGHRPGYRQDTDAVHAALSQQEGN